MIQVLIFLVLVVTMASIFFAKKDVLSTRGKIIFFIMFAMLIIFAWWYESNVEQESQEYRTVLNAFKQGKMVYCGTVAVDSKNFVFVSGTLSFIPRDKNIDHKGLVIDIATCKTEK